MPEPLASPDLVDLLTRIRARAQCTRRRVGRADHLSRPHLAADLAQIERDADALAFLILTARFSPTRRLPAARSAS